MGSDRPCQPMGSHGDLNSFARRERFGICCQVDFQTVGLNCFDGKLLFELGSAHGEYGLPGPCGAILIGGYFKCVEAVFAAAEGL